MADLNTFADIRKHRRMFADDIPGAHGRKADSAGNAFAGIAFATVDRTRFQIFIGAPAIASPIASAVPDGASTL